MAFQVFLGFLQVFQTHVLSVSSVFRHILQMFHLNILKVDRVLHMLQYHRWMADSGLLLSFGPFLMRHVSPSPLPPFPSLPFPPFPSLLFPPSWRNSSSSASAMTQTLDDHDARGCGGPTSTRRWWPRVGWRQAWCSHGGPSASWGPHSPLAMCGK
jgi:hypothetical protein